MSYYGFSDVRIIIVSGSGVTNNVKASNYSDLSFNVVDNDFTMSTDSFQETVPLTPGSSLSLLPNVQTEVEDDYPLPPRGKGYITNYTKGGDTYSNTAKVTFKPFSDILKIRTGDFELNAHIAIEVKVNYPTDLEAMTVLWDFAHCLTNPKILNRRETPLSDTTQIYHCVVAGIYRAVKNSDPFFNVSFFWENVGVSSLFNYKSKITLFAYGLSGLVTGGGVENLPLYTYKEVESRSKLSTFTTGFAALQQQLQFR